MRICARRHRVAYDDDLLPVMHEDLRESPRRLAFPTPRAHGCDRDDGDVRNQHRPARPEEDEVRAERVRDRGPVKDIVVVHVGVREDDLVDIEPHDQGRQVLLREDRDAVGVEGTCEGRGEPPALDAGDLRRGETPHADARVVLVPDEEVEEVAARGPHDEDVPWFRHRGSEPAEALRHFWRELYVS